MRKPLRSMIACTKQSNLSNGCWDSSAINCPRGSAVCLQFSSCSVVFCILQMQFLLISSYPPRIIFILFASAGYWSWLELLLSAVLSLVVVVVRFCVEAKWREVVITTLTNNDAKDWLFCYHLSFPMIDCQMRSLSEESVELTEALVLKKLQNKSSLPVKRKLDVSVLFLLFP